MHSRHGRAHKNSSDVPEGREGDLRINGSLDKAGQDHGEIGSFSYDTGKLICSQQSEACHNSPECGSLLNLT